MAKIIAAKALLSLSLFALPSALSAAEPTIFDTIEEAAQAPQELLFGISANFLGAAGSSSLRGEELEGLQGGGHDHNKRGFNLQLFELGAFGEMKVSKLSDIRFTGLAYAAFGLESVELEEASGMFSKLPLGLEIEFGHFLTEFGLNNPQHPHAWAWPDQNIALTRILGPEGMRGLGLRLALRSEEASPLKTSFHFGMQDAYSETMASFGGAAGHDHEHEEEEEAGIGGSPLIERETRSLSDFVYLNRGTLGFVASSSLDLEFGYSLLYGPNRSGLDANTFVWGFDFRATFYGDGEAGKERRIADLQAEVLGRNYDAAAFVDEGDPNDANDDEFYDARSLKDYGLYIQGRYWLSNDWAVGMRFEWAGSSGQSFSHESESMVSADRDATRDQRMRLSPMLQWSPLNNLRLRAHYNYDNAKHLTSSSASSFWLSLEYSFSTATANH